MPDETKTPSTTTCSSCGHDDPHPLASEWDDGGCTFLYATTAKGRGIGGAAITSCGCTATDPHESENPPSAPKAEGGQ